MEAQNENLAIMKRHNRKIVERAYKNSTVNAKYTFPKGKIGFQAYSEMSESISLRSRVSQVYDLHTQNNMAQKLCHKEQGKIASLTSILKLKQKETDKNYHTSRVKTLVSGSKEECKEKSMKKQFLSLTPKKEGNLKSKNSLSIGKTTGIKVTKKKQFINMRVEKLIQKNPQSEEQGFLKSLQNMTSRCFGNSEDQETSKESKEGSEVIFYSEKLMFSIYQENKKVKATKISNELTADSTPLIGEDRTKTTRNSRNRGGMSIIRSRERVQVSAFAI